MIYLNMMLPVYYAEYLIITVVIVLIIEGLVVNKMIGRHLLNYRGLASSMAMNVISTVLGGVGVEAIEPGVGGYFPHIIIYFFGSTIIEFLVLFILFRRQYSTKRILLFITIANIITYVILGSTLPLMFIYG